MLHQQASRLQYTTTSKLIKYEPVPSFRLVVKKQKTKKMKIDVQHSEAIQNGLDNFTTSLIAVKKQVTRQKLKL